MKYTMKVILPALLACLFGLTGCFSLSREEPPQRHYVLGGILSEESYVTSERLSGLTIGLRQPRLAEYLETPLIVVRHGPHTIRFSEFNRWGEDLTRGVNRAVAGYLAERAPFERVDVVPWPTRTEHDFLIQLHLRRFEGLTPAEGTSSEGEVLVRADWDIISRQDGTMLERGTTEFRADDWQVDDYSALVNRLDSGLRALSDDLIAALEMLVAR